MPGFFFAERVIGVVFLFEAFVISVINIRSVFIIIEMNVSAVYDIYEVHSNQHLFGIFFSISSIGLLAEEEISHAIELIIDHIKQVSIVVIG